MASPKDLDKRYSKTLYGALIAPRAERLPDSQAKTMLLVFGEGRSFREAASELGVHEGTVRVRIGKALRSLRRPDIRRVVEPCQRLHLPDPSEDAKEIRALDLSNRTANCLLRGHVYTVDELFAWYTLDDRPKIRNLGSASMAEIEFALEKAGLVEFSPDKPKTNPKPHEPRMHKLQYEWRTLCGISLRMNNVKATENSEEVTCKMCTGLIR